MKQFITVALLCIAFAASSATADRLKEVKEKTLVVEIPTRDTTYIRLLMAEGKQDKVAEYENSYVQFCKELKESFSKLWTYNEKIVFVGTDSLRIFVNRAPGSYAVIKYGELIDEMANKYSVTYLSTTDYKAYLTLFIPGQAKEVLRYLMPVGRAQFAIAIYQINSAIHVFLTHPKINQTDVNVYLKSKEEQPRFETKDLTLFILKDQFKEEINEKKLMKVYPYKFKIVERTEWDDALINKREGIACYVSYRIEAVMKRRADTNRNGTFSDDEPYLKELVVFLNSVVVASDGHVELFARKDNIRDTMADFAKQLKNHEKQANEVK